MLRAPILLDGSQRGSSLLRRSPALSSKGAHLNPLLALSFIFPWLLVGFVCWPAYQLVLQNGRILLRLEVIEQRLDSPLSPPTQNPTSPPSLPSGLPLGAIAPDFELPSVVGGTRELSGPYGLDAIIVKFHWGEV